MEYLKSAKGSWFWLVVRVWLGWQWVSHSWPKHTGGKPWDASGFLKGAVAKIIPPDPAPANFKPITAEWWGSFLNKFAIPNVELFNVMVPWGELLVGLALIAGFATIFAASMGALMNFSFLMSGATGDNPYLLVTAFLLIMLGGKTAGYIGVDYWFRPWFRRRLAGIFGGKEDAVKSAA